MSRTPVALNRHAPLLGQDTAEILAGLGYPDDEVDALVDAGTVKAQSTATMMATQ